MHFSNTSFTNLGLGVSSSEFRQSDLKLNINLIICLTDSYKAHWKFQCSAFPVLCKIIASQDSVLGHQRYFFIICSKRTDCGFTDFSQESVKIKGSSAVRSSLFKQKFPLRLLFHLCKDSICKFFYFCLFVGAFLTAQSYLDCSRMVRLHACTVTSTRLGRCCATVGQGETTAVVQYRNYRVI